jgi:hypothetical protein
MTPPALKIVAVLVTGVALGALSAGCSSAPAEQTSESGDDLRACGDTGCAPDPIYKCYIGYYMGANGVEGPLRAIGCKDKTLYSSNGGGTGWFQVSCPATATTTAVCPLTGATETMNAQRIAACYSLARPYYAQSSVYSACTDAQAGAGFVYVAYDPTCTGTHCSAPFN